jgi:23S rRNA maturation-related 3'-5' exoribonuclease YhaM
MKTISREHILEDLPEIESIKSLELKNKVVDAWVFALERSSFARVTDIPGDGALGVFELFEGMQDAHLRGVVRLGLAICSEFKSSNPGVTIDEDIIIAGALTHDIGKTWELDPDNQKRWRDRPDRYGDPSYRHSVYGVHVCLSVGLPEEIAHISLGHSLEGQFIGLSTECFIVRQADNLWWHTAIALGLCRPETIALAGPTLRPRSIARK